MPLDANGGDHQPNWISLDPSVSYWGVGGIRFFGVTNSTIDHNAANNDTDVSYSLFDSSHNALTANTADYPFTVNYLITDGSSCSTIHTDGPIGNEESPVDIVPSFIGGIVVLNGTYDNKIKNNQTWGSFGSDLAWAQAVPDASTAIGIKTWPPTLHCNVIASDGGGGVANLNGNVWSGNTYKTIDPCLPAQ
jgi:parallel beta-helix repeat protein